MELDENSNFSSSSSHTSNSNESNAENSMEVDDNEIDKRVPSSRDEPNVFLKLAGRNEVEYVEVCGWTRTNHIRFPGLRKDLKMKGPELPIGMTWKDYVDELDTYRDTISNLSELADTQNYNRINAPLLVQVVAKKKAEVLMLQSKNDTASSKGSESQTPSLQGSDPKRVYIVGNLLVADSTGSCIVTSWNEANEVFHDKVEVGDILLINKAQYKGCPTESLKFKHPFKSNLVNLELKIDKYDIRYVKHIPYSPTHCQKLPPYLFPPDESKLYLPSDILCNDGTFIYPKVLPSNSQSQSSSISATLIDVNQRNDNDRLSYFDIIGMITYVGGFQRYEMFQGDAVCLFDPVYGTSMKGFETIEGDVRQDIVKQYIACRWIQIIDKASRPLLVKVYLHKGTKEAQSKLVPGALVLITYCQSKDALGFEDYIQTSIFSYIYVNGNLTKYFKIMPKTYAESVRDGIISLKICKEILQRQDIVWSAGGVLPMLLINQNRFFNQYLDNLEDPKSKTHTFIPEGKTLTRREGFTICFRGIIESILEVTTDSTKTHFPAGYFVHKVVMGSSTCWSQKEAGFKCYQSCRCKRCELLHWFYYRRKLPEFQVPENIKTSVELLDKISKTHAQNYCGPLLLPAQYTPIPKSSLPPLGNCSKLDGEPYYRLLLRDEKNKQVYIVIWKGHQLEIMEKRWTGSNGRIIIGVLDFYCCETDGESGMEIILRDFIFEDNFMIQSTDSESEESDSPHDEMFVVSD